MDDDQERAEREPTMIGPRRVHAPECDALGDEAPSTHPTTTMADN